MLECALGAALSRALTNGLPSVMAQRRGAAAGVLPRRSNAARTRFTSSASAATRVQWSAAVDGGVEAERWSPASSTCVRLR